MHTHLNTHTATTYYMSWVIYTYVSLQREIKGKCGEWKGFVRCWLWACQTCTAFTSTSRFNLAYTNTEENFFPKNADHFSYNLYLCFFELPRTQWQGNGKRKPKIASGRHFYPFGCVQSYRWILCSNSIMKIRLPSLNWSFSFSSSGCSSLVITAPLHPKLWGKDRHQLEGKRSKFFQVNCHSNFLHLITGHMYYFI